MIPATHSPTQAPAASPQLPLPLPERLLAAASLQQAHFTTAHSARREREQLAAEINAFALELKRAAAASQQEHRKLRAIAEASQTRLDHRSMHSERDKMLLAMEEMDDEGVLRAAVGRRRSGRTYEDDSDDEGYDPPERGAASPRMGRYSRAELFEAAIAARGLLAAERAAAGTQPSAPLLSESETQPLPQQAVPQQQLPPPPPPPLQHQHQGQPLPERRTPPLVPPPRPGLDRASSTGISFAAAAAAAFLHPPRAAALHDRAMTWSQGSCPAPAQPAAARASASSTAAAPAPSSATAAAVVAGGDGGRYSPEPSARLAAPMPLYSQEGVRACEEVGGSNSSTSGGGGGGGAAPLASMSETMAEDSLAAVGAPAVSVMDLRHEAVALPAPPSLAALTEEEGGGSTASSTSFAISERSSAAAPSFAAGSYASHTTDLGGGGRAPSGPHALAMRWFKTKTALESRPPRGSHTWGGRRGGDAAAAMAAAAAAVAVTSSSANAPAAANDVEHVTHEATVREAAAREAAMEEELARAAAALRAEHERVEEALQAEVAEYAKRAEERAAAADATAQTLAEERQRHEAAIRTMEDARQASARDAEGREAELSSENERLAEANAALHQQMTVLQDALGRLEVARLRSEAGAAAGASAKGGGGGGSPATRGHGSAAITISAAESNLPIPRSRANTVGVHGRRLPPPLLGRRRCHLIRRTRPRWAAKRSLCNRAAANAGGASTPSPVASTGRTVEDKPQPLPKPKGGSGPASPVRKAAPYRPDAQSAGEAGSQHASWSRVKGLSGHPPPTRGRAAILPHESTPTAARVATRAAATPISPPNLSGGAWGGQTTDAWI